MTMRNMVIIFLLFYFYRYVGVLLYKIEHSSSDYDKTGIFFLPAPNFLLFVIWEYITKNLIWSWRPRGLCHFSWWNKWNKNDFYLTLKFYKEIYLWPVPKLIWLYKDIKFHFFWNWRRLNKGAV